jgi:hypothetical protein
MQLADREKVIRCSDEQFPYDTVVILERDGKVRKEIDLLEAIVKSNLTGLINSNDHNPVNVQTCDPLHLNDVQVLSEELAEEFPSFSTGDLLLSFRSLNGVGVLDPDTEIFKWFNTGASQHQHSSRYFNDNRILLFDNYGGAKSRGVSRVISIDVGSGQTEVLFPRNEMPLPDREFFSRTAGHIDIHPSGQRMLVAFSQAGILWEIDTNSGEVLWEFINTHPIDDRSGRIDTYVAKYVDGISFPMNGGEIP